VDERLLCRRCGYPFPNARKRVEDLCESCRARPAKIVRINGNYCVPWHGDFDEFDNPMLDGVLFMAGVRSCGKRDCVNGEHQLPK
jgi:hypothetical protein